MADPKDSRNTETPENRGSHVDVEAGRRARYATPPGRVVNKGEGDWAGVLLNPAQAQIAADPLVQEYSDPGSGQVNLDYLPDWIRYNDEARGALSEILLRRMRAWQHEAEEGANQDADPVRRARQAAHDAEQEDLRIREPEPPPSHILGRTDYKNIRFDPDPPEGIQYLAPRSLWAPDLDRLHRRGVNDKGQAVEDRRMFDRDYNPLKRRGER